MNRVILIYNLVPENIQIYDLRVNNADLEMLKACHNIYGNADRTDDSHPVNLLSEWLDRRKDSLIFDDKADSSLPYQVSGDLTIVVTGFIL